MAGKIERHMVALRQGDHVCRVFESHQEQFAAAVPFIRQGLARRERCLYVAADNRAADYFVHALRDAGVDAARERETGNLHMIVEQDAHPLAGDVNPQARIAALHQEQEDALANGFSGLRLAAEMSWAMESRVARDRLIEFEALLNDFLIGSRSMVLCLHDRAHLDDTVARTVFRTHPVVIVDELVCTCPFYEPSQIILGRATTADQVDWMMSQIQRLTVAEHSCARQLARLKNLSRRMFDHQEEARRHLARELHDQIGQVLASVSVSLHRVKVDCDATLHAVVDEALQQVDDASRQVRDFSLNLRPAMLDELGLIATIRWHALQRSRSAGFEVHFVADTFGARLAPEVETVCYRIVQEALTNVVRHATAKHVLLEIRNRDDHIELKIHDDGVGFDLATVQKRGASSEGLGILGMQERIAMLGGAIKIESAPNHGTNIWLRLPATSRSSIKHE